MNDLTYFRSPKKPDRDADLDFLRQFATFRDRWGGTYEHMTADTLSQAADQQAHVLSHANEDIPDAEQHVILTALRCLIMTHNLEEPAGYLPYGRKIWLSTNELTVREAKLEPHLGGWCAHPKIHFEDVTDYVFNEEVHQGMQLPDQLLMEEKPPHNYKHRYMTIEPEKSKVLEEADTLQVLLPATLSATQSLLLRKRPKDWPVVFFTLYILHLISENVGQCSYYSDALTKIRDPTKEALKTLRALYVHVCRPKYRPFSEQFDEGAYARLLGVEIDDMLIQRYGRHHRLWRDEIIQGCSTLGQIPVCAKLTA